MYSSTPSWLTMSSEKSGSTRPCQPPISSGSTLSGSRIGVGSARSAIARYTEAATTQAAATKRAANHGCAPSQRAGLDEEAGGASRASTRATMKSSRNATTNTSHPEKVWKKPVRRLRPVVVRQHTGTGHARGIGGNRNRNRRERDDACASRAAGR